MADQPNEFGKDFKVFADMVNAMESMAQLNRAAYVAHFKAGFSPEQAMQLTIASLHEVMAMAAGLNDQQKKP